MPAHRKSGTDGATPMGRALRLMLIYLAVALTHAIASDWVIDRWITDPALRFQVQTGSDVFFVLGTGLLIGYLAFRELKRFKDFQEHYQTVVEQNLAGLTVVRADRFLFVNQRFAEIFGYEQEEMLDEMQLVDVIAPEERDTVAENLRQPREGEGEDVRYRYTGVRKDGEKVRIEVYGRRIEWGEEPAVTSIHLDVTEEEILREQARRSQRLEALGELTAAVSHDFNNILTAIIAPLELCEDELGRKHPARVDLEEAKESAKRAVTLTRQLLAFSRRRIYRTRPSDMGELIRRIAPMLDRLVSSGVELHLELNDDLPVVEIDPSHFEQALLNLVTNAVEAVGNRGDVWIRARSAEQESDAVPDLVVEVSDSGRGMDEATQRQIFEPFFTTRDEGTGLGLATVHGIVKQARGEISVESEPGEGTTFRIELPGIAKEAESRDNGDQDERKNRVVTDGISVLVVDDEDAVRRVTSRVLERHGMVVQSASTAQEALTAAEGGDGFDVFLTDVGLPDMNVVDLADRIREMHPYIAVLYMSGHSDEEVLDRIARERSSGFVEKPFSIDELLQSVQAAASQNGDGRTEVS